MQVNSLIKKKVLMIYREMNEQNVRHKAGQFFIVKIEYKLPYYQHTHIRYICTQNKKMCHVV